MSGLSSAQVAQRVKARMAELSMTNGELTQRAQLDPGTVKDFLDGVRKPIQRSQYKLDEALGWRPGGIAGLYDDGTEPTVLSGLHVQVQVVEPADDPIAEVKVLGFGRFFDQMPRGLQLQVVEYATGLQREYQLAANEGDKGSPDIPSEAEEPQDHP